MDQKLNRRLASCRKRGSTSERLGKTPKKPKQDTATVSDIETKSTKNDKCDDDDDEEFDALQWINDTFLSDDFPSPKSSKTGCKRKLNGVDDVKTSISKKSVAVNVGSNAKPSTASANGEGLKLEFNAKRSSTPKSKTGLQVFCFSLK